MTETETEQEPLHGTVAIVGFPNVGKSTLINRLTGSRAAVVHETSGVTRDRKELIGEWNGKRFLLIDTGGVDIADQSPMTKSIAAQAQLAVGEADLVLFVVDASAGVTPGDEEVADILRRARKPVLLIANKIDDPAQESLALDLHRLGLGDPLPISALHGHGSGDLLDLIVEQLPGAGREETPDDAIRVAILGRPNVGKSSLLNAILGHDRVIVSETPGNDPRLDRHRLRTRRSHLRLRRHRRHPPQATAPARHRVLLGTACTRSRRARGHRAHPRRHLRRARRPRSHRRRHRAQGAGLDDRRPVEVGRDDARHRRHQARARAAAETAPPSRRRLFQDRAAASSGCWTRIEKLYDKHTSRVSTAELNRFLAELREKRQPPSREGRSLNLLYGAQVSARPPRFRFSVNDQSLVTRDYGYWVENQVRERFELEGVPVTIDFVPR